MIRFLPFSVISFFTICAFSPSYSLALDVPPLTGRIVDVAHLLPADVRTSLSDDLAEHERKTGNQIAVLTLPSLEGEALEDYSHRAATTWKLGRKGSDNGVLVLVVPRERRIRIEVGYGLEGKLTDAATSRIIRGAIVPRFKAGDFAGGISAGVQAIMAAIEGSPIALEGAPRAPSNKSARTILMIAVILGAFVGMMVGRPLRVLGGLVSGGLSFFIGLPSGLRLALMAGGIGMVVAFVLAALSGGTRRARQGWDGGWGTGWGGGYGGGGFPSSDTFSGGGGDFGGGGASGRW